MSKRKLWLLVLLFGVYALLVWLLAYVFFPDSAVVVGLILTVCGLTLLFVYILISRLTSRLAGQGAPQSSPESSPPQTSARPLRDEDAEPIGSLIAEANDHLGKSPTLAHIKVKPSLTGFPLYLLLGAEGSGKTSLFVASELLPELLAGEAYRESSVVPTRLLNLWFAGGSIVAELSGRFFSEEPSRLQRAVAMLLGKSNTSLVARMLSNQQAGQQFKGAILCCPIDAFQGVPDAARQSALVRRLQERLRAIGETLGASFPVYVIFTKCDTLPYFDPYFARLAGGEDKQILGCTLPALPVDAPNRTEVYANAQSTRISDYFNRLYSSLADQRATFLRRESDGTKKPDIYEFPRELKRIRGPVVQFLVELFRPNPLQPGPLLRGFYFVGTRQVSSAEAGASRVRHGQTGTFKLGEATRLFRQDEIQRMVVNRPAADEPGLTRVWSFVPDLLQQIIVADRGRVGGAFVDRKLDLYRRIAFGAAIGIGALFTLLFLISWLGNRSLLHEARGVAAAPRSLARASDTPSRDDLVQIESLRSTLKKLTDRHDHGTPWSLDFGLYAGNRILPAMRALYFQRFREYFLNAILAKDERTLAGLPASQNPRFDYKTVYDDLKGYRTITTSEEPACSVDGEFAQWIVGTWQGTELAERQFRFYMDELRAKRNPYPDLRSAPAVVKTGRNYLASYSGIEPLYHGIIASVNQESQSTARLSDYTQRAQDVLVLRAGSEVPAAFTRAGWDLVQKRIANSAQGNAGNPCVLGLGHAIGGFLQGSNTQQQLTNMYIRDYIERWRTFLEGASVQPYKDPADASKKLDVLSSNGSPLLAVLAMTAENTKFPTTSPAGNILNQAEGQAKRGLIDRLRRRAPAAIQKELPKTEPDEVLGPDRIAQVFQPVQTVFQSPNRNRLIDDANSRYISALGDLQTAMGALAQNNDNQDLISRATDRAQGAQREVKQITLKFDSRPGTVGDTVSTFLAEPITVPIPKRGGPIEAGLKGVCAAMRPMLRKYPFNPQAEAEVDLRELQAVFAPAGGILWNLNSTKVLEQHGHEWSPKEDTNIPLNPRFVVFFNKMAHISYALFPPDGEHPRAEFKLSLQTGQGYQSVTGQIDDDKFDSTATKQYSWPGLQPGVDLRVLPTGNTSTTPFALYPGPWGLFRWMQSAENRPPGAPTFGFVNQRAPGGGRPQPILEAGTPIRIQVSEFPGKIDAAFDRDFFTGLECPARATQQ